VEELEFELDRQLAQRGQVMANDDDEERTRRRKQWERTREEQERAKAAQAQLRLQQRRRSRQQPSEPPRKRAWRRVQRTGRKATLASIRAISSPFPKDWANVVAGEAAPP